MLLLMRRSSSPYFQYLTEGWGQKSLQTPKHLANFSKYSFGENPSGDSTIESAIGFDVQEYLSPTLVPQNINSVRYDHSFHGDVSRFQYTGIKAC